MPSAANMLGRDKGTTGLGLQGEEVMIVSFIEPLPNHSKTLAIQNLPIHA